MSKSIFCPLDDRYSESLKELKFCGEFGFMKFRLEVEIKYFLEIVKIKNCIPDLNNYEIIKKNLQKLIESDPKDYYLEIKEIEKRLKHDVKAVEYYLRQYLSNLVEPKVLEMIHYGLTSQDINTPALSLQLKHFHEVLYHNYQELVKILENKSIDYKNIVMLAKTHGQPAIPTTIGNQFKIVKEAMQHHLNILYNLTKDGIPTKFGGAVGHLNAHYLVDPNIEWHNLFDRHLENEYHLRRIKYVTQNLPYTYWSPIFDSYKNLNCIISDFCQDIWLMISNGNFHQHIDTDQVGSSAMPQKINPIDFENAEGNADMAINIFEFLSRRLTKSRLQRDLTDSTILRNLPMPFGYSLLSVKSLIRGLNKITPNLVNLNKELESEPTIISEGLQTLLRDAGYPNPYEILRKITQNNHEITLSELKEKILNEINLEIPSDIIIKIKNLNQYNYLGSLF